MTQSVPRILVLDDDPLVTRNLEVVLRMDDAFDPKAFNEPDEALVWVEKHAVDAMLVDFQMPRMTGLDFLGRAKEFQPAAARLMLTGYADKDSAIRAINDVGLYQYLEKPWDNQVLKLALRNAVERTRLLRELREQTRALNGVREDLWRLLV